MTAPDVAALAARLTKAGAVILRRMRPDVENEAFYLRSSADVWVPAPTLNALVRRGLVQKVAGSAPQRYRLTPLGLSVRQHLLEGRA